MFGSIARSILCFVVIASQPDQWSPIVSDDMSGRMSVLAEQPNTAAAMEREIWFEAKVVALVPLVRTYLNERVLFGSLPSSFEAERWWRRTLENDPAALAAAISTAETKYLTWDVRQWPESMNSFKPAYRLAIVEALFESYNATAAKADRLNTEIAAFKPVNRFSPVGPGRGSPSDIKDPAKRAEYQARLDEIQMQSTVEQEMDRTTNVIGELTHLIGTRMKLLYRGSEPEEIRHLANLIVDRDWKSNDLYMKIIEDWPELDELVGRP